MLNFREHGTFKKDTLDALKWATEDMWSPEIEKSKDGEWSMPTPAFGCDWETGEMLYN